MTQKGAGGKNRKFITLKNNWPKICLRALIVDTLTGQKVTHFKIVQNRKWRSLNLIEVLEV